jgi:hypothetical protein
MPTLPEYLMIFPVFVKFTLLVFYVCGVRVQSCLFVLSLLFLLSLFVQSLYCHILTSGVTISTVAEHNPGIVVF